MKNIDLIYQNESFENIFHKFNDLLDKDSQAYRGHCYRILNYMQYMGLDTEEMEIAAVAIPFHDIGVWTHDTMDYLELSFLEARKYIRMNKLTLDEDKVESMILGHHTIRKIRENDLAEKLRKADLIDLSFSIISFGIPTPYLKKVKKEFPYQRFQQVIFKKVIRYAFQNPGRPFPMIHY